MMNVVSQNLCLIFHCVHLLKFWHELVNRISAFTHSIEFHFLPLIYIFCFEAIKPLLCHCISLVVVESLKAYMFNVLGHKADD